MPGIQVLDEQTIDKIAAGEVIERPSSVVKELVENAIDAGATAVTVEIKDGGISLIRITDNGQGIPKNQVPTAFLRHATSKITTVDDLLTITSLGFRGEALSSIAAVAQVELITKVATDLTGTRYVIEGSQEKEISDIGAPDGTTFLVRNLFYNTPARQKFLKSAQTEASYISTLMERLALSHADISFQFIANNQPKLHTNGNTQIKDIIYQIFGRELTAGVLPVHAENELFVLDGFIGKPFISRGNRNFEMYFINGRYIKSPLLSKAIEDAYKPFLMKHQYPFTVLCLTIDGALLDVNVHPAKLEVRFSRSEDIYKYLLAAVRDTLAHKDMVPDVSAASSEKKEELPRPQARRPEPFEKKRLEALAQTVAKDSPYEKKYAHSAPVQNKQTAHAAVLAQNNPVAAHVENTAQTAPAHSNEKPAAAQTKCAAEKAPSKRMPQETYGQLTLAEEMTYHADFIKEVKKRNYTVIGQLFDTYWLVQVEQELFIIDQHAAHEKVLYEKLMRQLAEHSFTSQQISPPIIVTMSMQEEELFLRFKKQFVELGYEINPFGGREYAVCAVPANLYDLNTKELFLEMLDDLSADTGRATPELILDKIATMSCKAAVKGNQKLSEAEARQLLAELLALDNPYNCPHGRPTIIAMSRTELEKKFKRIVS